MVSDVNQHPYTAAVQPAAAVAKEEVGGEETKVRAVQVDCVCVVCRCVIGCAVHVAIRLTVFAWFPGEGVAC